MTMAGNGSTGGSHKVGSQDWLRRLAWPARLGVSIAAVVLVWLVYRAFVVPQDPLTIDLGSDSPIPYSVSLFYQNGLPRMGIGEQAITPEYVTVGDASQETTVTVTALDARNPKSIGNKVWLYEVSSKYETVTAADLVKSADAASLTLENDALELSGGTEPLQLSLSAGDYCDVKMLTYERGGTVSIAARGQEQIVDLYAAEGVPAVFRLPLPVPLDVTQTITTEVPATAESLTITFLGGPRTVRLDRVRLGGYSSWAWDSATSQDLKLGPGVNLNDDSGEVVLEISGETGSVTFPSVQTKSYWMPRLSSVLSMALGILTVFFLLTSVTEDSWIARRLSAFRAKRQEDQRQIASMGAAGVYDSAARPAPAIEEIIEAWRYRHLIVEWVKRDIKTRYKRSFLGVIWTMLNPLGTMVIMTVVFSQLFKQTAMYPVYVLTGLTVWNFFQQATTAAPQTLLWSHNLIHRVYLPRTIFSFSSLGSALVNLALSLIPLGLIRLVMMPEPLTWPLLFVPVAVLLLALFALGVGLLLSSVVAFFPDIMDIYSIVLTAWLYLSAIFYPYEVIPVSYRWWFFNLNPIYHLLLLFRDPLYYGNWPSFSHIAAASAVSLGTLAIGWLAFTRKADELAYRI